MVTSAGIAAAVPVLQKALGTQVPLASAAGLAAGLAGRLSFVFDSAALVLYY